jgi:DNA processing protein
MAEDRSLVERAALLALLDERPRLPGEPHRASWSEIALEVALRGSASALWDETRELTLDGMTDPDGLVAAAAARLAAWVDAGMTMVTVLDANYPAALRAVHDMPPVLFTRGSLRGDDVGISIVGSREASSTGLSIAAELAEAVVGRGLSVISGLAEGIDTAAHEATWQAAGRPIGVIGTGINTAYPPTASSRALHQRVAETGVLISQFLPDAPPSRTSFPMRNATMSGLGQASIIVEAGEHSGTRTLVRAAIGHGRPVIITSRVVDGTDWGKRLVDRPGVFVAATVSEVMDLVEGIVAEDVRIDIGFPPSDVVIRLPDIR